MASSTSFQPGAGHSTCLSSGLDCYWSCSFCLSQRLIIQCMYFVSTWSKPSSSKLTFRLLRRKAQRIRHETGDERWQAPIEKLQRSVVQTVVRSCYRPVLLLTLEPMCLCLCIFSAILLGILYLFFGAFQLVFGNVYGFSLWQIGCSFLGLLVGIAFAIVMDPVWRRIYARLEHKHEMAVGRTDDPQPEWRLPAGECTRLPLRG